MKKKKQPITNEVRADCTKCKYAGAEDNYMVFCSIFGVKRAAVKRKCIHFKKK